jgi:hypothetical protein
MNLSNLQPAEIERIAYANGDTLAAQGWGAFAEVSGDVEALENDIDNALDLVGCAGKRGEDLYAALHDIGQTPNSIEVMESALQTIAAAFLVPGKVGKRQLVELSKALLDIVATPGDFSQSSARKAVYTALNLPC